MKSDSQMPKFHELMNPLLEALHELSGREMSHGLLSVTQRHL